MLDLGRQYAQRLRAWRMELYKHQYTPVGKVSFEAFTTYDHMTCEQADAQPRRPFPSGTHWGAMWEYAWFTADVTLPDVCKGNRVVMISNVGGEQLVYANGKAIGSVDKGHPFVTLTRDAQAGQRFHLQIETYAGHGARLENYGPCPPERKAIPDTPACQCTVNDTYIAVWNETAYQLLLDVETLDRLLQVLPDTSLRAQKVAKALDDFTHIADYELPFHERQKSFQKARDALRCALECHNGSTAPTMWIFGQSHIDLAWLWPFEETCHKSVRTYSNQLTLMEEYPEYLFMLCEPALMETLKERDGELWQRTLDAARRGQIFSEGAFYVECDTNMPSGESLIRQLSFGKKWYRDNLGVDSRVGWQPDTFGFSGALPQILKKMNVPYFATQKLLRADPEADRFPFQHFIWEGIDGSEVLALSFMKNNAPIEPVSFAQRWEKDRTQMTDIDTMLYPYGYGDGGGGPTRDFLEMARRLEDLEGVPRARYGGLREYFEHIESQNPRNRWVGEMYLPWHRGTYTAQRRQKMLMRRLEFALHDMELLMTLLPKEERAAYGDMLHDAWNALLLSQFHDLAGGVGIKRVHEETVDMLKEHLSALDDACAGILKAPGDGYSVCNMLTFARAEWVCLPDDTWRYVTAPGASVQPLQADVPQPDDACARTLANGDIVMENAYLRMVIDTRGRVVSAYDKQANAELVRGLMNDLRLYRNVENVYDAWELSRDWQQCEVEDAVRGEAVLTHNSSFRCETTVRYQIGDSTLTQVIRLMASSRRVDFDTVADWHENHKMLKAHFESNVLAENVLNEIQFGYVQRPAHASGKLASDRYEVSNHRYSALCEENRGFALLNNGIYGLNAGRGELALTLLRSPLVPDDTCDRGKHRFTYSLYPFAVPFAQSGVVKAGYALNCPLVITSGIAQEMRGASCESDSVILETVKPADDGDGLILRLYESLRGTGRGTLQLPKDADIYACDMGERERGTLMGSGKSLAVTLKPFEILTLRAVAK